MFDINFLKGHEEYRLVGFCFFHDTNTSISAIPRCTFENKPDMVIVSDLDVVTLVFSYVQTKTTSCVTVK